MSEDEIKESVVDLYPKFFINLTGNTKYKFKLDDGKSRQIDLFINQIKKNTKIEGIDSSFLNEYFTFTFGRVKDKKFKGRKNAFPFSWIIGKNPLDIFLKTDKAKKYVLKKEFIKTAVIKDKVIKTTKEEKEEKEHKKDFLLRLKNHEENEKQKFYNSQKGFLWCVDFTTLHNPLSDLCQNCKFSEQCIELQKQNYKEVYRTRNEGKI